MNLNFIYLPQNTNNNNEIKQTVIQKWRGSPKETMGLVDIGLPQSKK